MSELENAKNISPLFVRGTGGAIYANVVNHKNETSPQCCGVFLYEKVLWCGRTYHHESGGPRIIVCPECGKTSILNTKYCQSDRLAFAGETKWICSGVVEPRNFPTFLQEKMGRDCKEMLLKERAMARDWVVIYHICNPGHWKGKNYKCKDAGLERYPPCLMYETYAVLNSIMKGKSINSIQCCLPRFAPKRFRNMNFERFVDVVRVGDCSPEARSFGLVGVGGLVGCYQNSNGGMTHTYYCRGAAINAVPNARKLLSIAAEQSQLPFASGRVQEMVTELLGLAKEFEKVASSLLQIFIHKSVAKNHVLFSKNGGRGSKILDENAFLNGLHIQPETQLNVFIPPELVEDSSLCEIITWRRMKRGNSWNDLQFRKKIEVIIRRYM